MPGTVKTITISSEIQNGSPDGILLFDLKSEQKIDSISYEGQITEAVVNSVSGKFDLTNGNETLAADNNFGTGSIGRLPNGMDTNDDATDWSYYDLSTPGLQNGYSGIVINEVDYDNVATDTMEFVELYNNSSSAISLASTVLIVVNGATNTEFSRHDLSSLGNLAPGEYAVVGSNALIATLPTSVKKLAIGTTNILQNGSPDGVMLFDTSTEKLLDALSYEGSITAATLAGVTGTFDLVSGTATVAQDIGNGSLIRIVNGTDTGNDDTDWQFTATISPGTSN